MKPSAPARWLIFFHQLPAQPAALRVRIWRRLAALGAVLLKNSVYVLPSTDAAREDLHWLLQEIETAGGEGAICQAVFIAGLSDAQVVARFQEERSADYAGFIAEAAKLVDVPASAGLADQVARLRRRLGEIVALDFFASPAREGADAVLDDLERRARAALAPTVAADAKRADYRGRTWTTRAGIYVDRIASAWLIRRFIDAKARFRFLDRGGKVKPGEVGFDLAGGEFTHVGEHCSFEVLVERFGLDDPALRHLADIIHDLDIKDGKHLRPETAGIATAIRGITLTHPQDAERLAAGCSLFDSLLLALRHQHAQAKKPRLAPRG